MTANATNNTNGTASNMASVLRACGPAADLVCGQSLWPPEFLQDAAQLLLMKAAAANAPTTDQLGTWRSSIPPCTNSSVNASCSFCDDSVPAEACGTTRLADGVQLCNWRYVECRDRRVVTINMALKVIHSCHKAKSESEGRTGPPPCWSGRPCSTCGADVNNSDSIDTLSASTGAHNCACKRTAPTIALYCQTMKLT